MTDSKLALITGANQGLGLEITKALLTNNWQVYGIDLNESPIKNKNYTHIVFDLTNTQDLNLSDVLMNKKLDLLVCNAGFGYYGDFSLQSIENLQNTIAVNFKSPLLLTKKLLNSMKAKSQIIFIGSVSGFLPAKKHEAYGATKAAILGFARSLRRELAPNIAVRVYHPGPMKTEFHQRAGFTNIKDSFQNPEDVAKHFICWLEKFDWQTYSRLFFRPLHRLLVAAPTLPTHIHRVFTRLKHG